MYVVWKKRPLSATRSCELCGDRSAARCAFIPHLVGSRRVDGRPRQVHIARLPSIRSCCLRSAEQRAAWWRDVDPLLVAYDADEAVWFKLAGRVPPVDDEWDDAPAATDAWSAASVLGLHWPCRLDEVKAAFRTKAKQTHPDLGGRAEDFRRVSDAYQELLSVLSGPLR